MERLNKTQLKKLIEEIKENVKTNKLKINTFRAIKEFLKKYDGKIYKYKEDLYFIDNLWIYDIKTPKQIEPLPNTKYLFCGFTDTNDDIWHYWLKDKKILKEFGITYAMYKNFNSINWFITRENDLYINNKYWTKPKGV